MCFLLNKAQPISFESKWIGVWVLRACVVHACIYTVCVHVCVKFLLSFLIFYYYFYQMTLEIHNVCGQTYTVQTYCCSSQGKIVLITSGGTTVPLEKNTVCMCFCEKQNMPLIVCEIHMYIYIHKVTLTYVYIDTYTCIKLF